MTYTMFLIGYYREFINYGRKYFEEAKMNINLFR